MASALRSRAAASAAAPAAPQYTITIREFIQREEDEPPEQYGAYRVLKEFFVRNSQTNEPVNGFIIQRITKRPRITWVRRNAAGVLGPEELLTTSAQIEEKTKKNVKFMSDDYFEIFDIIDGKSEDYDGFQNGAIVEYDKKEPITDDDFNSHDTAFSKGRIIHSGASVFFPEDDPEYEKIIKLRGWTKKLSSPANGLNYIPYSHALNDMIFHAPKSNIVEHTVTVNWAYPTHPASHTHESQILMGQIRNIAAVPALAGGARRKTRRRRRQH